MWIRDNETLCDYCHQWQQLPFITLDTEFFREVTFYPVAGLIQLSDGKVPYLIDPLTISDWRPLAQLLTNQRVVKILHACSEDLELLYQLTSVIIRPVFDTQLAAAFLNMGITLGYSPLVQQLLNKEVSKEEKRSDWLKRPLTTEQEQYAAADVMYLIELYEFFLEHLSQEKQTWLFEDTTSLAEHYAEPVDVENLYKGSRQAWRLSSQQLTVLRELYRWREHEAMTKNIARGRLLKDNSLFMIAKYMPISLVSLAKIPEIHPSVLRKEGEKLLSIIKQSMASNPDTWPQKIEKPVSINSGKFAKLLKVKVYEEAQRLFICPELLWRKKIIEPLLDAGTTFQSEQLPESLQGWRKHILSNILLQTIG